MATGPTDGTTPSQPGVLVFGTSLLLWGLQIAWQWMTYDVLVVGSRTRGYVTGPFAGMVMGVFLIGGSLLVSRALAHLDRTPRLLSMPRGNARLGGALIVALVLLVFAIAK